MLTKKIQDANIILLFYIFYSQGRVYKSISLNAQGFFYFGIWRPVAKPLLLSVIFCCGCRPSLMTRFVYDSDTWLIGIIENVKFIDSVTHQLKYLQLPTKFMKQSTYIHRLITGLFQTAFWSFFPENALWCWVNKSTCSWMMFLDFGSLINSKEI